MKLRRVGSDLIWLLCQDSPWDGMLKKAIQERLEIFKTSRDNDVLESILLLSYPLYRRSVKLQNVAKVAAKDRANNASPENENPVRESQGEVTANLYTLGFEHGRNPVFDAAHMGLELVCIESDQCARMAFRIWCANQDQFPGHFAESKIGRAKGSSTHGWTCYRKRKKANSCTKNNWTQDTFQLRSTRSPEHAGWLAYGHRRAHDKKTIKKEDYPQKRVMRKAMAFEESPTRKQEMKDKENAIRLPWAAYKANSFQQEIFLTWCRSYSVWSPARVSASVPGNAEQWRLKEVQDASCCLLLLYAFGIPVFGV